MVANVGAPFKQVDMRRRDAVECGVIGLGISEIRWAFSTHRRNRSRGDVLVRGVAWKEPVLRPFDSPPGSQDL